MVSDAARALRPSPARWRWLALLGAACAGDGPKDGPTDTARAADSAAPDSEARDSADPETGAADSGGHSGGGDSGDSGDSGDTGPAPCDRSGALVYGLTDMVGSSLLEELGLEVTVWDADQWTSATVEDFAAFRLIIVGEQSCDGPDLHGELMPLLDSRAVWGAAIDGRVMASGIDLECHTSDWDAAAIGDPTAPRQVFDNAVGWLTEACATNALFATDWGRRHGEHLDVFGGWDVISERGDHVDILTPSHPLFDGVASDGLNDWASTFHSAFRVWPSSFEIVASNLDDEAIIALRDPLAE